LRILDYLLFQRPNILESTVREDIEAAMSLCLAALRTELNANKFKVKFALSVRGIARLLRGRRHHPHFSSSSAESASERSLAARIEATLNECLEILPAGRVGKPDKRARLCELTKEWLLTTAQTNVLGPPEDDGDEDEDEIES
jgi:hypothetical protein